MQTTLRRIRAAILFPFALIVMVLIAARTEPVHD